MSNNAYIIETSRKPCFAFSSILIDNFEPYDEFHKDKKEDVDNENSSVTEDPEYNFRNFLKKNIMTDYAFAVSRLHDLKNVSNLYVAQYLEIMQSQFDSKIVYILSECYEDNLQEIMDLKRDEQLKFSENELVKIAYELIEGLAYLNNEKQIEVGFFFPQDITFDTVGHTKLVNYGRKHLGKIQDYLIKCIPSSKCLFLAPEYYITDLSSKNNLNFNYKSEMWSLGMILFLCVNLNNNPLIKFFEDSENNDDNKKDSNKVHIEAKFAQYYINELMKIYPKYLDTPLFQKFSYIKEFDSDVEKWFFGIETKGVSVMLRDLISKCLEMNIERRYCANDLIMHPLFKNIKTWKKNNDLERCIYIPSVYLNSRTFCKPSFENLLAYLKQGKGNNKSLTNENILNYFTWNDLLYFWKITNPVYDIYFSKTIVNMLSNQHYERNPVNFITNNISDSKHDSEWSFQYTWEEIRISLLQVVNALDNVINGDKDNLLTLVNEDKTVISQQQLISDKASVTSTKSTPFFGKSNYEDKAAPKLEKKVSLRPGNLKESDLATSKILEKSGPKSVISQSDAAEMRLRSNNSSEYLKDIISEKYSATRIKQGTSSSSSTNEEFFATDQFYKSIKYNKIQCNFITNYLNTLQNLHVKKKIYSKFYFISVPDPLLEIYFTKILDIQYDFKLLYDFLQFDNSIYHKELIQDLVQLENDIPRCHQYSPIMNSYTGKKILYKVMRAWMNLNPQFNYFQGLESIAYTCLCICNWKADVSCKLINCIANKYIKEYFQSKEKFKPLKERMVLLKWLITFCEPSLSVHLDSIGFQPELYATPWLLSLFSSVFPIEKIIKIWQKMILFNDFIVFVGLAMLLDLKTKLLIMNLNECLSTLKALESCVDIDNCVKYATVMSELIPRSMTIIVCGKEAEYKNEFYQNRPWEIPDELAQITKKKGFYISVFDLLDSKTKNLIIDVRTEKEYEECSIINSIHIRLENDKVNEVYIEYLQQKSRNLFNFETIEEKKIFDESTLESIKSNFFMIVIVGNYEKGESEKIFDILIERDIRNLCILRGGIQAAKLDAPDILKKGVKSTNIAILKKEIKVLTTLKN